jgi:hypothetical protein
MWDEAALRARIANPTHRTRFPGASPDAAEIALYEASVSTVPRAGPALVLGMTPELRQMAVRRFDDVTSVDASEAAIDVYGDWIDPGAREAIVRNDWLGFLHMHPATFSAILGDGIFGNLPDWATCEGLIALITRALRPEGRFVTRMALVPEGLRPERWSFATLVQRYRDGDIDGPEFALTARLFGHVEIAYETSTSLLDNDLGYGEIDRAAAKGQISASELETLRTCYFKGRTFLPGQREWEDALDRFGMSFRQCRLHGKLWHDYYPIYECRLGGHPDESV